MRLPLSGITTFAAAAARAALVRPAASQRGIRAERTGGHARRRSTLEGCQRSGVRARGHELARHRPARQVRLYTVTSVTTG